jgi:hypothetical protein
MKIYNVFIVLTVTAMFGCSGAGPDEETLSEEAQALGPPAGTTAHPGSMQLSATPQTVLGVTGRVVGGSTVIVSAGPSNPWTTYTVTGTVTWLSCPRTPRPTCSPVTSNLNGSGSFAGPGGSGYSLTTGLPSSGVISYNATLSFETWF